MSAPSPLASLRSLKVKLGVLIVAAVLAATLIGALGAAADVQLWLVVPVTVGLALGLTQLLAAGMVAPLRQMTEVAGAMAHGDYSGRVRTDSTDEVGRLAAAFNAMAEDLAAVERERRDLIATVSHELRTPLTALTAQLENLADGVVPPDPGHLEEALAQAERLGGLVRDLLDLARVDGGVVRPEFSEVALAGFVAGCVAEVTAAGRDAAYDVAVPADLVVVADPLRLRQLLVNVFDNAGRHSPVGGTVRIGAGTEGSRWWLEVRDAGPGVAAADRERVFDRFGTAVTGGGTGLGLAVARWSAQVHGGTLRFLDPGSGESGARLRLDLPRDPDPATRTDPVTVEETLMPTTPLPPAGAPAPQPVPQPASHQPAAPPGYTPAAYLPAAPGVVDSLFGRFWAEPKALAGLGVVLTALGVGIAAAVLMQFPWAGLGWTLVLLLAGGTAYAVSVRRRRPFTIACTVLSALLVTSLTLRATEALPVLATLTAAAVFLVGVTGARSVLGVALTGLAWPLAGLRGLPWLGRSVRIAGTSSRTPAVARTLAFSLLGLIVFGALFASADALFASWVDAILPDWSFGTVVGRAFLACAVAGLTLAAAYLALNPPRVELDLPAARLGNRWEWLVPVLVVDLVFVAFLAAQATVVFGGHRYLEQTTGITYADYVHQGFGQLTIATALTLLVVGLAARRAGGEPSDRAWLRGSLGLLCVLTLVVVASALYRMHVYQQAYGFTTLRLTVDVFEGWLGFVVLAVMGLGVAGLGRWLPRVALLSGAIALLGLLAVNPDAWVAERNIDRYASTGKLDTGYLSSLSPDASAVIADRLPADLAGCILGNVSRQLDDTEQGWRSFNLGRAGARGVLDDVAVSATPDPYGDPCAALAAETGPR